MEQTWNEHESNKVKHLRHRWIVITILLFSAFFIALTSDIPSLIARKYLMMRLSFSAVNEVSLGDVTLGTNTLSLKNVDLKYKIGDSELLLTVDNVQLDYPALGYFYSSPGRIQLSGLIIHLPNIPSRLMEGEMLSELLEKLLNSLAQPSDLEIDNGQVRIQDFTPWKLSGFTESNRRFKFQLLGDKTLLTGQLVRSGQSLSLMATSPSFMFSNEAIQARLKNLNFSLGKQLDGREISTSFTVADFRKRDFGRLVAPMTIDVHHRQVEGTGYLKVSGNTLQKKQIFLVRGETIKEKGGVVTVSTSQIPMTGMVDWTPVRAQLWPKLTALEGVVEVHGNLRWKDDSSVITPELVFHFHNLQGTYDTATVRNLKAQLTIDSLHPLRSKPSQTLSFETVEMGKVFFQNGLVVYQLGGEGGIDLKMADVGICEGQAHLTNMKMETDSNGQTGVAFDGEIDGIELRQLIRSSEVTSLNAQGKISGRGKFRVDGEGLEVTEATFRSKSTEGLIQYFTPPINELARDNILAIDALKDLHFTLLDISLREKSPETREVEAIIRILGFNPKVHNGYPFEFNIETSGKLGDLLKNTLTQLTEGE